MQGLTAEFRTPSLYNMSLHALDLNSAIVCTQHRARIEQECGTIPGGQRDKDLHAFQQEEEDDKTHLPDE